MSQKNSSDLMTRLMTAIPLLLVVGTLLVVAKRLSGPVVNSDTYFHLRLGAEFLDGWSADAPGSVSRFATADWFSTQWLGQLGLAGAERVGGLPAVAALTAVAVVLMSLTFFLATRSLGSLVVAAALTPLAVLACAPALSGRPQVLSYAFCAMLTAGWLHCARGGRIPWWAVPLTWVWALVHGMWSVSLVISAVAIVGLALDRRVRVANAWKFLAVPVLSLAAAACTPIGTDIFSSVARVGSITSYFAEWAPPNLTSFTNLIACGLACLLLLRISRRATPLAWTPLLLALLAGGWLIYAARTVPLAVAMLLPLLGLLLSEITPERPRSRAEAPVLAGGTLLAIVAAVGFAQSSVHDLREDSLAHHSVDDLPAGTGLLNEWGEGGYDMWRHQDLDIVSHGYGDMFTDAELHRNVQMADLDPGWYDEILAMDVQHALLYSDSRLLHALVEEKGWKVVARDVRVPGSDPDSERVQDLRLVHLRAP